MVILEQNATDKMKLPFFGPKIESQIISDCKIVLIERLNLTHWDKTLCTMRTLLMLHITIRAI